MNEIYKLVKKKSINQQIFKNYLQNNQIDIESIKQFKNSWGESLLTYSVKYGNNIEFFEYLYQNGFIFSGNFYSYPDVEATYVFYVYLNLYFFCRIHFLSL